jgi:hypothetical protein
MCVSAVAEHNFGSPVCQVTAYLVWRMVYGVWCYILRERELITCTIHQLTNTSTLDLQDAALHSYSTQCICKLVLESRLYHKIVDTIFQ